MRSIPDGSINLVCTDPPYGVDFRGRWSSDWSKIENDSDLAWLPDWSAELSRLLPKDGFVACFYSWPHADRFLDAFRKAGFRPTSHLVFIKNQMGLGYHTRGGHEQAYLFAKGSPKPNKVDSDVFPWTRAKKPLHPTQKPFDAIAPLVKRFARPGELVLDPFMGSGTTGVACLKSGRRFLGIEIDPTYHRIAERRIAAARTPLFDALATETTTP